MAKRICALAAALILTLALSACGSGKADTGGDTDAAPNGSAGIQPDTGGTDQDGVTPGDSLNGGSGVTSTAARGTPWRGDAAAPDSGYRQMLQNGQVTDTDGFLDNDR